MDPNIETIHMEQGERRALVPSSQRPPVAVVLSIAVVVMVLGSGVYILAFYLR
jgi:hypothetical protein